MPSIILKTAYKDKRNNSRYIPIEFIDNYRKIRCKGKRGVSVIVCSKIAEKYFKLIK